MRSGVLWRDCLDDFDQRHSLICSERAAGFGLELCQAQLVLSRERKGVERIDVNFRLERVARIARESADNVYKRQCGLDSLHIRVLRLVAESPGQAVNAIVRESMLERSQVSRIISHVVRQKLIERTVSQEDARQLLLAATAE